MKNEEFFQLVKSRRNIRKFSPDPVPDGYIEKIIDAARWAQSGSNGQPWEFVVVKDKATRAKIVEIYMKYYWPATWGVEQTRAKEYRHPAYANGYPKYPPGFKDAPVFIIVCGDPRSAQASIILTHFIANEGGPMSHFLKSMGNATQILNLAAAALDLGSQWVSINRLVETQLKILLDIPDELTIHTLVPVGYPAPGFKPKTPYRREVKEIMHIEKYDRSRYRDADDFNKFFLMLRNPSHHS
jgi:nitroreductase